MIHYTFKKENGYVNEIKVKGHALFGDYGTDIVCASVSTALIMTANAIETLGFKDSIQTKVKSGDFVLKVLRSNATIEGLLQNLIYTLNELEAQYKSHIKNLKEE
ncbi:ribosomal-processing cysteine protease Prp [Acholeplasma equirhinis]|uniref:ribosomal-processing cysteine protease Prp n=1 Tax=Acholeplasma equirhinis TaxID=555393 RepID=UPI00197B00B2|nr:ribosomal-processing cysteine protease Prp [Acholeplasma equirhinis]MBN3490653.1 ribosomal-processing cysteine protease Prp [Acholeplasma equirhinis]